MGVPVSSGIRSTIWAFASSKTRTAAGYAGKYRVPALAKPARAAQLAASIVNRDIAILEEPGLWKHQIEISPVLGCASAFRGPVRCIVQMIGDLCRPIATDKAVVDIALHGLAKPCRAAGRVNFPAGRKHQRATHRHMR